MASSKVWTNKDGGKIMVDTPTTLRAKELCDLYKELISDEPVEQRLGVLLRIKNAVKAYDCTLSHDIIQLVNREGDLLCRGRDGFFLEGLRKRITLLFLQFIGIPEFNPEASSTGWKKSIDHAVNTKKIYKCQSCCKLLPATLFPLTSLSSKIGLCSACMTEQEEGTQRSCTEQYKRMLGIIRFNESVSNNPGMVSKYMTENDVRQYFETFWGARSCVSGYSGDITKLVIVRWNKYKPISPWNAVVLTLDEARVHLATDSLKDIYSEEFCSQLNAKLEIAKTKYARLYTLSNSN